VSFWEQISGSFAFNCADGSCEIVGDGYDCVLGVDGLFGVNCCKCWFPLEGGGFRRLSE
jgi:hypothetical protein